MKNPVNMQTKNSRSILDLMEKNQIIIEQVNGQRKLNGPPANWVGPPPGPGTEVFVGKLPRGIFEDTVYPFFAQAGEIYEMRLMMDFSGNNRGYCFVTYATPEEAENAIKTLNDREIIPGRRVGVIMSINNCKLWIGRLPKGVQSSEVILKICSKTAEVDNVAVYKNGQNEAEFAIVTYKSHRGAAMARRTLVPEKNSLFSNSVSVDWANPDITPCNMIEESGLAVKNQDTKNLYFLKSIKRKVIGFVGNRSLPLHSKSREEVLYENIDCYLRDNLIISSPDQDPANLKATKNSNMFTTSKQKKPPQNPPSKVILAPEAPNSSTQSSPFQLPRPVELSKQYPSESFSLFDDFTFSHPPKTEQVGLQDQGWAAPFDQLQNLNQNNCASNCWVESVIPRFSSLNLQSEEARSLPGDPSKNGNPKDGGMFSTVLQEKALPGQRAKIVGPINAPNPFQPVIWPEKGFPFHPPGPSSVTSGVQCPYSQIPGMPLPYAVCPIPYDPCWAQNLFENRAYFDFNQHHCLPSNCAVCMEAYTHSNRIQSEHCNLTCYNQHLRFKEVQVEEDTDYQQQPESNYQPQAMFKGRRKQKSVPKVNPRRRKLSENQEIAEQHNFISKPADNIPKGARPILSARK